MISHIARKHILILIVLLNITAFSQLSGTFSIPGDYFSISSAVSDLNISGISGPVVFNVSVGHTEVSSNIVLTTNTSSVNTITFQKSGIGTNPQITAAPGVSGSLDGIIIINGTDYVTFDGIDVVDAASNTNSTQRMEYGYALLKTSGTNGTQHAVIKNCKIGLYSAYVNTLGIYMNNHTTSSTAAITVTTSDGTNSFNKFFGITIDSAYTGIRLNGFNALAPYTFYDQGNEVGTEGANAINKFGGASTTAYGIIAVYQNGLIIANSTLNGGSHGTLNQTAALYGMLLSTGTTSNVDVYGNTITLTTNAATLETYGIENDMGGSGTSNTVNIYNNSITNCSLPAVTSGLFYAIYHTSSAFNVNIYNNQITNNSLGNGSTAATGVLAGIYAAGGTTSLGTWQVYNNTIDNLSRTQSVLGAGVNYGIYSTGTAPAYNVTGNTIKNCNWNSAGLSYCINNSNNNPSTLNINNNTIDNIQRNARSAGTTYGIYVSNTRASGVNNINNNVINKINNYPTNTTTYFGGINYGIFTTNSSTSSINISGNTVDSLQLNGSGNIYGISNSTAGTLTVINNNISKLINSHTGQIFGIYQAPGSGSSTNCYGNTLSGFSNDSNSIFGIYSESGSAINIYRNNLYDFNSSGNAGAFFGICTGSSSAGATTIVYNNYISDLKAVSSSAGFSAGIYVFGTTGNNHNYYNNSVYLNQSSSGPAQVAGIYANTIPTLDLRNNIIVVNCASLGGTNVAYRRSGTSLLTYSNSSNNNDFYAGGSGSTNKYFFDGTNSDLTLTDFKIRVSPRDVNSFSEIPPFINIAGTPYDLRIDSTISTQCESNAQVISTPAITSDYDLQARYPNAGYPQHGSGLYPPSAPDVGADEFGGIPGDVTGPTISYTPLTNGVVSSNRSFAGVTVADPSGVNTTSGTRPRCYYKKSSENNTYAGNTTCDNGWKWVEANGTSSPFDFTIDYTILYDPSCITGSVSGGDIIQYFVVAQDNASTPNVGVNSGAFASPPSSVNLTLPQFPVSGTIRQYVIGSSLSGLYSVGASETYTSLTGPGGFFEAVNNSIVAGNITIQITSDLNEDGTNALNEVIYTSGPYTINIVPADPSEKLISGNVSQAMIRFDGSGHINVDGNNGLSMSGSKYLRFRNTSGSAPTFTFINDSKNNTIANCYIEGNNSDNTEGVILFGTTSKTNGNDNNSIIDCDVRDRSDASGLPAALIVCNGTTSSTSQFNSGIVISGCNLYNFYQDAASGRTGAIMLWDGATDWAISDNSIFQEAARTFVNAESIYPIWNNTNTANNLVLTGNYIGGSAPLCSGSPMTFSSNNSGITFHAIRLFVGSSAASSIQGNTISNLSFATRLPGSNSQTFSAIILPSTSGLCNIGNISGNTIGSSTGNGSISVSISAAPGTFNSSSACIYNFGSGSIQNNSIGSINFSASGISDFVALYAIYMTGSSAASLNITDNLIGSNNTSSSINNTSSIPYDFVGIRLSSAITGTLTINNNTIRNIRDASTSSAAMVKGIFFSGSATSGISITNNTVSEITSSTRNISAPNGNPTTGAIYGIITNSPSSGHNISGNVVSGLRSAATGAFNTVVKGICVLANSSGTISSNKVFDLTNQSTGSSPYIYGLYAYFGNWTCSNNMVSITNGEITDNNSSLDPKDVAGNNQPGDKIFSESNHTNRVPVNIPPVSGSIYNASFTAASDSKTIYREVKENIPEDKPAQYRSNDIMQNDFTNGLLIQGIHDEAGPGTWSYFYNTVYIGGNNGTGTNYSVCYSREISASVAVFNNNLLVNSRLGTGSRLAIRSTVAGSWTSNYNSFVTPDTSIVGLWSSTSYPIDGWRSNSGGDKQSWAASSTVVNPINLFNSVSAGDLSIKASNPQAWFVSGKGIANTINIDMGGDPRPTSIGAGVTDIGADEFTITSSTNPSATQIGIIGAGLSTEYRLYGRTLSRIDWNPGGITYPSGIDVKYYSGFDPPNVLGGLYGKSYWRFTSTGLLSGTSYDISIYFGNNETYTISTPSSNTVLAKYDASWEVFPAGIGFWKTQLTWNSGTGTYITKVPGIDRFSDFALTDGSSPLPVQISSFSASISNVRNVNLHWVTDYEVNNTGFDVERRMILSSQEGISYTSWEKLSFIPGNGTTNEVHNYKFIDHKLPAGKYEYRLRQIDVNGTFEYFNLNSPSQVEIGKPIVADLSQNYPNPSNPKSRIDYQIPYQSKVSIVVYDLLGKEVIALVDEVKEEGYFTVDFDGSNLASGIYFYRLIAEGKNETFSKTQKLVLVK